LSAAALAPSRGEGTGSSLSRFKSWSVMVSSHGFQPCSQSLARRIDVPRHRLLRAAHDGAAASPWVRSSA
jgi:hypothetical protein